MKIILEDKRERGDCLICCYVGKLEKIKKGENPVCCHNSTSSFPFQPSPLPTILICNYYHVSLYPKERETLLSGLGVLTPRRFKLLKES
jgi:hypothetical protein